MSESKIAPAKRKYKSWCDLTPEQKAAKRESKRRWGAANPEIIRAANRAQYTKNKEACNATCRAYHATHRIQVSERGKLYRAKNKTKISEHKKAYYAANREKYLQARKNYCLAHTESVKQQSKDWYANNPLRAQALGATKRARRRGRINSATVRALPRNYVDALVRHQSGLCNYCGAQLKKPHIDHIMPLALGGLHALENLQLLCPTCNLKKGVLHPDKARTKLCPTHGVDPSGDEKSCEPCAPWAIPEPATV